MRIIAKRTLQEFWKQHPATETPLKLRYYHVKSTKWHSANDVIKQYPIARSIGNTRFIFKIKGNRYRLIVRINFDHQLVLIRFIGSHQAYDKIDAKTI